ncbi:hypothetical protein HQQ81_06885 [Microbacteriaceae bacterium VKM Ac-2854]|nr:hypothetical protein [Microbacteriaceae bacterium VKM Ac-2854]
MIDPNRTEPDSPNEQNGASRRLLVGTAALVAAAGATTAVSTPAGAWAAPAVKQILGLPGAAASTGALARVSFDGSQSPSNAAGTSVALPAVVVLANVGSAVTIPAGSTVTTTLSYDGFSLVFDRPASAAAATLDGAPIPGAVVATGSSFTLLLDLAPDSIVRIPLVVTVAERVVTATPGVARASYQLVVADASPVADRSAEAATTISGPMSAPSYYEFAFEGTRQTAPSPSGKVYDYPAYFTVRRGPDADPYNTTSVSIWIGAGHPWVHFFGAPERNGVVDDSAGSWDPESRFSLDEYIVVKLPLAPGDVLAFPYYILSAAEWTPNANGGVLARASGGQTTIASATGAISPTVPYTGTFDAAIGYGGPAPALPTDVIIRSLGTGPVPVGMVADTPLSYSSFTLSAIGTASVDGVPVPDAVVLCSVPNNTYARHKILTTVAVPTGSVLTVPLVWRGLPRDLSEITTTLVTVGRDAVSGNNSVTRALN